MAFLFYLCWLINNKSIWSGLIGCLCYFYNHSEATRVMWTPALRESFSFPFHLLQMIALSYFLRLEKATKVSLFFLTASTLAFLLPWQFAQFSLATQAACLFAVYSLGFLTRRKLVEFVISQSIALGMLNSTLLIFRYFFQYLKLNYMYFVIKLESLILI